MSRLFQRAYERAPHIRFDLRILGSQFIEDLDSGVIDMLIIPKSIGSPDHPSAELFSDTFSCVVWKGNREIRDTITRQQYLDAGHVLAEWDGGRLSTIDESSFAQSGLARRREITAPSFSLAPQFLIGTQRIATIQTRLAHHLAKHWPIRVLRCPIATPPITEIVQWHRHQEQDPAIRWLLDLMREVAREVTGDDAPAAGRVSRVRGSGRA